MTLYTSNFFDAQRSGAAASANAFALHLFRLFQVKSVVDVGCGTGTWLAAFRAHGVERVLGIDGEYVNRSELEIQQEEFVAHDLQTPLCIKERFDLAICMEVAEHIPLDASLTLVDSLTKMSDVILFSAAVPGQVGVHHVNLRWQSEWAFEFQKRGYIALDALRSAVWNDDAVEYWYAQNAILYVREAVIANYPALHRLSTSHKPEMLNVVHPRMQIFMDGRVSSLEKELSNTKGLRGMARFIPRPAKKAVKMMIGRK
jgi:SAM-dependent methyltransferase